MRAPPSTALGHRRRNVGQDSRLRFGTSLNNIVDVFEHLFRALHDALQKIKLHILRLLDAFLAFYDRKGKTSLETMLKRWYTQLEKEYRNHIEG